MTEINFYHLTSTSPDEALPKLLERSIQAGFRVLVWVGSEDEAERVNGLLWTYNPDSFLPHGTARDGYEREQPIFITADEKNPNAANLLVVTHGQIMHSLDGVNRVLDIFNGANAEQVNAARVRWKQYGEHGHKLVYVKQNASGGWEKQSG